MIGPFLCFLLPSPVRTRSSGRAHLSIQRGKRLAPQNVADALNKIVAQANARPPEKEQIRVTPHLIRRHTAPRTMAKRKGIRYAQQMARHASGKYIWRYVQPSRDEMEEAVNDLFD